MMSEQIVLHFEVFESKNTNTEIAAQALLDWVALTRAAAAAIDPLDSLIFEIVGVDRGSTRFPQIIRFAERSIENISAAWDDYPYLKKMVIGSAHTLSAAIAGGVVAAAMAPDVQQVEFSDRERTAQEEMISRVVNSKLVQLTQQKFYRTIELDPAIKGVGVAESWSARPSVIVPRSEFSERSGLWLPQEINNEREQIKVDIWDVVLLKAAFASTPQTWQFSRDGLKFGAKMHDAIFLQAVKDARVPINVQEGVVMTVEVERKERLNGQVWEPISGSWRITKVISPVPVAGPTPLPFANKP